MSKYEHDPLFWVSDTEGLSLLLKICGACGFFMIAMASKLDTAHWLQAISSWPSGRASHLLVAQASSHLLSCFAKETLLAAVFLMFLLHWDLYACPQTLAIASGCLRNSALVRALVFLCWCKLSFCSQAVEHLAMESNNQKRQWKSKILRKRLLLWLVWCVLTLLCSSVAILYQVSRSIPGFLPSGTVLTLAWNACIGILQAVVTKSIMPWLANKVTRHKHVFTTASNLIMNCLIPVVMIMCLDTGCLGRWVELWKPCRSDRQLFQYSLVCNTESTRDCSSLGTFPDMNIDIQVMRSMDICSPHLSAPSHDLSAIAIDSLTQGKIVAMENRNGGGGVSVRPRPRRPPPPRKRSLAMVMCLVSILVHSAFLFGLVFASLSWYVCLAIIHAVMLGQKDRLRVGPNLLGFERFVWQDVRVLRHWGRLPWWGGLLTLGTTVPWGDSPREGRAAHGPLHPAVCIPLGIC